MCHLLLDEVAEIRAKTGLSNLQVRRWTHTARTRNYLKRIEETGMLLFVLDLPCLRNLTLYLKNKK